ncbi:MAG: hypothetical protein K9H64_08740 [Bacteroidales bacterium]|nr:hypothetical protein [Bacteroidales bacterium]MCF8455919.1 hypothetical protein [Bacteroidales bacterium]
MNHYQLLADLLRYPDNDLAAQVKELSPFLKGNYMECHKNILAFEVYINIHNLTKQQENYIRTFDVNALCYLDIGYILFGEDYKRGEFLVKLSNEHKIAGNDCGSELADHLPNLLTLLSKTPDKKMAEELAYCLIIPAIKDMIANFKDESNVYKDALRIILTVLEKDFKGIGLEQFNITRKNKDCFSMKGGMNGHSCGINQRTEKGFVANPY